VVSGVPIDNKTLMVTSKTSRSVCAQSFGSAHKSRVYICVHRGECACVL
jgi:hypothetical protein